MKNNEKQLKILVVRFQRIGDAILASPVCNSLKKSFPNSTIDYVLYEPATPIFKNHPYIDHVICISKKEQKNLFLYVKRVWQITRKEYDIVIDIMSTPKSELFTLFSWKSKYRIGRYQKKRGFTYTHKQKEPLESDNKIDKFLKQLLPPLEKEYSITYSPEFKLSVSTEEKEAMKNQMIEATIDFEKPIVAFSVISRVDRKTYPLDLMKEILQYCLQHYDLQLIFFYSEDQKDKIQQLEKELGNPINIFTNIITKDIRELMALLANSTCYIGNEGGARHLAQALDIPSFALFNPSAEKKEWLPYPTQSNTGFEPYDVVKANMISKENFQELSYEEQFRLLSPEFIIPKLDVFLQNVLNYQ